MPFEIEWRSVWRVVYYFPNPMIDWRVPVAAVVIDRDKNRHMLFPPMPTQDCLNGSKRSVNFLELTRRWLSRSEFFADFPATAGPQLVAGPIGNTLGEDEVAWVRQLLQWPEGVEP